MSERKNGIYQSIKNHAGKIITGITLAGTLIFGPPAYVKSQDFFRGEEIEKDITHLEEALSEKHDMYIKIWTVPSKRWGRPVLIKVSSLEDHSPYMALKALEGLEEAMQYYPEDLLKEHLKKVEIVRSFTSRPEELRKQDGTRAAYMTLGEA